MNYSVKYLPLALTLSRFVLGLCFLPVLVVYTVPLHHWLLTSITTAIFIGLSLTDYYDGYYARKYGFETALGKMLDPLADKMLMVAMAIALLQVGYIHYYAVIILLAREIIISGLRAVASEYNISLDVIWLAKIKTFLFSVYCVCALWGPFHSITIVMLWATTTASVLSGLYYVYSLAFYLQDSELWLK